jgi:hypothetical protein
MGVDHTEFRVCMAHTIYHIINVVQRRPIGEEGRPISVRSRRGRHDECQARAMQGFDNRLINKKHRSLQ